MNREEGDREVDLVREGWMEGEREGEERGLKDSVRNKGRRERDEGGRSEIGWDRE